MNEYVMDILDEKSGKIRGHFKKVTYVRVP